VSTVCLAVSVSAVQYSEEKRPCYVTVTALPPAGHCSNCSQLSTVYCVRDSGTCTPRPHHLLCCLYFNAWWQ